MLRRTFISVLSGGLITSQLQFKKLDEEEKLSDDIINNIEEQIKTTDLSKIYSFNKIYNINTIWVGELRPNSGIVANFLYKVDEYKLQYYAMVKYATKEFVYKIDFNKDIDKEKCIRLIVVKLKKLVEKYSKIVEESYLNVQ